MYFKRIGAGFYGSLIPMAEQRLASIGISIIFSQSLSSSFSIYRALVGPTRGRAR